LNGVVAIVGLVVLVLVALAAALWLVRRRTVEDVHSVDDYRHTLSTLQTIRTRSESTTVRVVEPPAHAGATAGDAGARRADVSPMVAGNGGGSGLASGSGAATTGLVTGTGRGGRGSSGTDTDTPPGGLRFDDVRPTPATPRGSRPAGRKDRAMSVMNHGPRRLGGPVAAGVVVIALVVTLLVVGARTRHPHPAAHTTSTTAGSSASASGTRTGASTTGVPTTATPTTAPSRGHTGTAGTKHKSARSTTTTTTQAAQYTPVSTSALGATYTPPSGAYSLVVSTTTGKCWVQVRSVSSGTTLFAQTLNAGVQQAIAGNGAVSVVLGAPSLVSVTLDGSPVVFPPGARAPLTLTFTPVATGTSVAGGSSTTVPANASSTTTTS
jgi:hypothetical protein